MKDIGLGETSCRAAVKLVPECDIYKGHFRGRPITPGACLLKIAEELLAEMPCCVSPVMKVRDVRYLHVAVPSEVTELVYEISCTASPDGSMRADVKLFCGDVLFAKMVLYV